MESLKKYDFLQKHFSLAGRILGLDFLTPAWKWGHHASFNILICGLALISYFYYLKKFWDDFEFVCYSTIIITPLIGIGYRIVYWPYRKDFTRCLYEESMEFCKEFSKEARYRKIIEKHAILYNLVIVAQSIMFINGFALLASLPLLFYVYSGETMILPLPIYIIGLNFKTHPGYEIDFFMNMCDCYVGVFTYSYIQGISLFYIAISTCMVEVLRSKVVDLERSVLLAMDGDESTITNKFKEIVQLHDGIVTFSLKAENMLSLQYFLDVTSLTVLVVMSLFYTRLANWIPGYMIAPSVLFSAFFHYGFGELNMTQLDKLNQAAYNVSWYRLSVKMQKMYIIFLANTQKSHFFTCGGLRPINVDLYASFCKSVYSYFLILLDFQRKIAHRGA